VVEWQKHGELGIIAAMAGHFNVPTVLVTGDRWACLEGKALISGIEAIAVKEGVTDRALNAKTRPLPFIYDFTTWIVVEIVPEIMRVYLHINPLNAKVILKLSLT